jgi:hypothetical protein
MRIAIRQQKWAHIQSIPDKELTTFIFNKHNPGTKLKILNSHEIQVDGRLFDVARTNDDGKTITYHCVYDNKEETVIEKTRKFNSMAQPMPAKNNTRLIIENIIKTAFFSLDIEKSILPVLYISSGYTIASYSDPSISVLSPPPQSFC